MTSDKHQQQGFTLVEVTLATAFIAIIIGLLATVTINIIRSYNKGVWLSQINQAGQQLNTDIGDKARYSTAAILDNNDSPRRLCVGGVSYLWNTEANIDTRNTGNNVFADTGEPFSLIRIDDPNAEYCSNASKQPNQNDQKVSVLLGRGATIQEFNVQGGISGGDGSGRSIPLLSINTVISTEGANRPVRAYTDEDGTHIDVNGTNPNSTWQCGNWYDDGEKSGVVDNADRFEPAENQYCSFAEYNITVYERSRQK